MNTSYSRGSAASTGPPLRVIFRARTPPVTDGRGGGAPCAEGGGPQQLTCPRSSPANEGLHFAACSDPLVVAAEAQVGPARAWRAALDWQRLPGCRAGSVPEAGRLIARQGRLISEPRVSSRMVGEPRHQGPGPGRWLSCPSRSSCPRPSDKSSSRRDGAERGLLPACPASPLLHACPPGPSLWMPPPFEAPASLPPSSPYPTQPGRAPPLPSDP